MHRKINSICLKFNTYLLNLKENFIRSVELHIGNKLSILKSQASKLEIYRSDLELMKNDIESNKENITNASSKHLNSPKFLRIIEKFRIVNNSFTEV